MLGIGHGGGIDVRAQPLQDGEAARDRTLELQAVVALRDVGRALRVGAAEELHEGVGAGEVALDRGRELQPALRIDCFRQHLDAVLLDVAANLLALFVEVVGDLREEDRAAGAG